MHMIVSFSYMSCIHYHYTTTLYILTRQISIKSKEIPFLILILILTVKNLEVDIFIYPVNISTSRMYSTNLMH